MDHEVSVKLAGLEFPRRCVNGHGAGEARAERAKVFFYREDEGEDRHEVVSYEVWLCGSCAAAHERERWRPGVADYAKRLFAGGGEVLGGGIVGVVGLFFLKEAVVKLSPVLLVFSCWPLGTAWFLIVRNWKRQAHRFVGPATSVMEGIDFTDDQAAEFEPAWARFTFRDASYAEAFRETNRERIWNPGGAEAVVARQKRAWAERQRRWWWKVGVAALVLFGLAAWWFGWD